jgi:hypothetical protein
MNRPKDRLIALFETLLHVTDERHVEAIRVEPKGINGQESEVECVKRATGKKRKS